MGREESSRGVVIEYTVMERLGRGAGWEDGVERKREERVREGHLRGHMNTYYSRWFSLYRHI